MNEIKKIITINTINKNIELFLQENDILIDKIVMEDNNSQAELLVCLIEDLLKRNNLDYKNLDYISIINGPGSFIGLKTSLSVVKAMKVALNIPVVCSSLFDIISYKKDFDFVVLKGDFNSYYVEDKNKNYFYVKKDEINDFIKNIKSVILTNNNQIVEELKNFNIKLSPYLIENVIKINYEKVVKNDLCSNIKALYIKLPDVNTKKYEERISLIKHKMVN